MSADAAELSPSQAFRSRRVRQEFLKLIALVAIAASAFLGTRAFAAHSRAVSADDAAKSFAQGQQAMARGDTAFAIDAFRRALQKVKDSRDYSLALARALEHGGDTDAAERALLSLREAAPEDAEVNLELARIAAYRSDTTAALRYYRNALYAPQAAADENTRRTVRLELIRFLLGHGDRPRALSELLVAANDTPPDAASAVTLGDLFASAGDYRRAQDQYLRALKIDSVNPAAIAGAGTTAFQLGNYSDARRYLGDASTDDPGIVAMREVADHVMADDPLASRIGSAERYRRLATDFTEVSARVHGCVNQQAANAALAAVAKDVDAFGTRIRSRASRDTDTLDDGLSLLSRAERAIPPSCGEPAATDRALLLIAKLHGADGA